MLSTFGRAFFRSGYLPLGLLLRKAGSGLPGEGALILLLLLPPLAVGAVVLVAEFAFRLACELREEEGEEMPEPRRRGSSPKSSVNMPLALGEEVGGLKLSREGEELLLLRREGEGEDRGGDDCPPCPICDAPASLLTASTLSMASRIKAESPEVLMLCRTVDSAPLPLSLPPAGWSLALVLVSILSLES